MSAGPRAQAELVSQAATRLESAVAESVSVAVGRRFGLALPAGG